MNLDREKIWRCDCGSSHFVSVQVLDFGDRTESYLTLETYEKPYPGIFGRIRSALGMLKGYRHEHVWAEILLDKKVAREIAGELLRVAEECE